MVPHFFDRGDAGRLLARRLLRYAGHRGTLVLGLPRGGVPVAYEIARQLDAPLDVLVVRRLSVPCREELTIGAVAPGGACVLNDELIDMLDIESDAIHAVRLQQEQELEQSEQLYRGNQPPLELAGKTVIVVDEGIATAESMHAAVLYLHQQNAARVIVATPVISPAAYRDLQSVADEVVAVLVPEKILSVGQCYDDFSPTTDEEVRRLLGFAEPERVPS